MLAHAAEMIPGFELAPQAILRAALFPLERLEAFGGAPEIRTAADYDAAIARERRLLVERTVGDPAFARALALANPEIARRALRHDPAGPRKKRQRHLETTLFRYLARAVGRTDPCGAWSGVGLAAWSDARSVEPARPAVVRRFSADLAPWQFILRALGRRADYVLRARWVANPSLREREPDVWTFSARAPDGTLRARRLRAGEAVSAVLRRLPSLPPLRGARIARRLGDASTSPVELVLQLAGAGVLVGGLDLPAEFSTARAALLAAGVELLPPDRAHWRRAIAEMDAVLGALARGCDRLGVEALLAHLAEAEAVVARLHRALAISAPLPAARAHVRCDSTLPWTITLGREDAARLLGALDGYQGRGVASPSSPLRRARDAAFRRWVGEGRSIFDAPGEGLEVGPHELPSAPASPGSEPDEPRFPPLGVGLFRGLEGAFLDGIFDEPAALYGRFAPLFAGGALGGWISASYRRVEVAARVHWVELVGDHVPNPNVLARPRLLPRRVSLWRALPGAWSLSGARIALHPATGRPVLELPGVDRPVVTAALTAADLGQRDPSAALCLRTSFRDPPTPNFRAGALVAAGSGDGRLRPRVEMSGGTAIRPAQAILAGAELARLLEVRGYERFVRWRSLADAHGWPRLARVRISGDAPLLVPTESPLAVEALFEGVDATARELVIEGDVEAGTISLPSGARHAVELAVPFLRTVHAFTPVALTPGVHASSSGGT